jgi:hypothetical protein
MEQRKRVSHGFAESEVRSQELTLQLRIKVVASSDGADRANGVESEIKVPLGLGEAAVLLLLIRSQISILLPHPRSKLKKLT